MKVRILGCSGGIGGQELRTTSLLIDDDVLVDAGTGVGHLSFDELVKIDHVFLTHSHLDHLACLPFIVDTVGDLRRKPLVVHANAPTLQALRDHIFNWTIWPDFCRIPSAESPYLTYEPLVEGHTLKLGERRITALPANHTVPAVAYRLDGEAASLVFTGDTTACPELWSAINSIRNLRYLLVETAFANRGHDLAVMSKHLCPSLLAEEVKQMRPKKASPEIFITHLKPGQREETMSELEAALGPLKPRMLRNDQVFEL